jgi:hypothetical protein
MDSILRRGAGRRLTVIADYRIPAHVRQRFTLEYSSATFPVVEAGIRQWFRLAAQHPRAKVSMPSVLVDALWHRLMLESTDYPVFCDLAFGRYLGSVPVEGRLLTTFRLAQRDEACGRGQLPVLFRVDQEADVPGGRRYLVDCGGRGQCFEAEGVLCLAHFDGPGRPLPRRRVTFDRDPGDPSVNGDFSG